MNNFLIALTALSIFSSNSALTLPQKSYLAGSFTNYQAQYGKKYDSSDELSYRQGIYQANLEAINDFNNQGADFMKGQNQFTDMTKEERAMYLGLAATPNNSTNNSIKDAADKTPTLSGAVSWTTLPSSASPTFNYSNLFPSTNYGFNYTNPFNYSYSYTTPSNNVTPASVTPASVTPASVTPASVTPASVTPASVTPANVAPASVTPASVTPASVAPAKNVTPSNNTTPDSGTTPISFTNIKQSVNWVTAGAVTPVKDQGSCGGCYAFSSAGLVESLYKQKFGVDISLSEQQLLNCSKQNGCNGGLIGTSLGYIQNNGIHLTRASKYTGATGTCDTSLNTIINAATSDIATSASVSDGVKIASYKQVGNQSLLDLLNNLQTAPVSIAFNVTDALYQYKSGVFSASSCTNNTVNHAVLAVGYNLEGDSDSGYKPYVLIKNSWGSSWGLSGYFKAGITLTDAGSGTCGMTIGTYNYTATLY